MKISMLPGAPPIVCIVRAMLVNLFIIIISISAMAQGSTDGVTPAGLSPGSPAGSYPLSDFDVVNLYNGTLNFRLPLYKVGGRGGAAYPITLHVEKKWTVHKHLEPGVGAFYYADAGWWSEEGTGSKIFAAGRVDIRSGFREQPTGFPVETLARITFTAPDGTEYELRDQLTNGRPVSPVSGGFNRGKIFVTGDGTTATFVSDWDIHDDPTHGQGFYDNRPDGDLMLKDGTRFRVDDGTISWMRDRNGNKVTFVYDFLRRLTSVTDSLHRLVTISYPSSSQTYTQISYKGFGGGPRTIKIGQTSLSNALRSDYTLQTVSQLFPELHGGGPVNSTVINYIELPDGRQYQLRYNPYAELARVVLPTGGAVEYDHAAGLTNGAASGVFAVSDPLPNKYIYRRVIERRIYPDGGTGSAYESKITYSRPETTTTNLGYVISETRNASGTLLAKSQHYFHGTPRLSFSQKATHYGAWKDGNEYKVEVFDTNGSTILRRTEHTFAQRAAVSWWGGTADTAPPNDPRTTQTITTIEPAGTNLVSKQTFEFDDAVPFNNQNNVKEYAFGTGTAGALLREARTTFVTSTNYTDNAVHLRGLPLQVSIYDGGGTERGRTVYEYDNYTTDSNHAALTNRSNISGFDSSFSTSYTTRGNATATIQHFMVSGSSTGTISTFSQYDIAGNIVKAIDGRSNATSFFYTDCFGAPNGEAQTSTDPVELGSTMKTFAFSTEVRNALNQSTFSQFDYYLGQPVDGKDVNGVIATGYFNDNLDRPTEVRQAVGMALEYRTVFNYDDTNRIVTTTSDRDTNNDGILVMKQVYDLMGRTIETRQHEGGTNYIATQTQYDALGRAHKISNPFRPWQSEAAVWTTKVFDALGRVTSVTTPDNAVATTSYSGNTSTVSDQTGKQRKSVSDALGRLIEVYEAPNDAGLNYLTSYAYDALDNLITVTQGTQTRTFVYDSLKRLTSATNPESGVTGYLYDNNGNLLVKTDARNVSTHFEYDVLNRPTRRWYNGSSLISSTTHNSPALPAGVGATNEARFYYDAQSLPGGAPSYTRGLSTGRVVAQIYGSGSNGDYFAYDALGRQTLKIQQTGTVNYQMIASYNRAGAITSLTYPSGRTVSTSYDAAGRTTTFSGNLGDGTSRTYANEIIYSPFGSTTKEKFGTTTPVYNKLFYNVRGQLAEIRASTSYTGPTDTDSNRGAIVNHYSNSCAGVCAGSSMTDNNSNLKKQEIVIPGHTTRVQEFSYDNLNRLLSARELVSGAEQWKQQFTYDRWGNRTINNGVTYGAGINNKAFTVNTSNNRLEVPGGQPGVMQYDNAGNLTNDTYTGVGNRTYDGENKITSAWGGNNQAQLYGYDATGHRIKRTVDGMETWQVYGIGGELLAEYPASGVAASPQKEYGYRNGQLLITANGSTGALTNFALNKTATQSSTHASGAVASRAVDGNTDGVFANNSVTHTLNDLNAWWQVDLGQVQTINTIKVWNRAEFPERLSNFYVFVSDQPFTSTNLTTTLNQAGVSNFHTAGQGGFPTQLTINRTGRYVRVQLAGTNYLSIAELQVLGIAPPTNVALNKTATQSSTHASGAGASRAVDGNTNGVFTNNSVTHTLNDLNAWWHVDLGQVETIGTIKVWNRVEFPERLSNFYVFVSDQPFTSTSLSTTQNQSGVSSYHISSQCGFPTEITIARTGRYVRVQLAGTNYLSIAEVEVWTGSAAPPVQWLVSDHLGTPRLIFDQTGDLTNMKRHDYLPFGEELFAGSGGRTSAMGYSGGDGVRQQFIQDERDIETGLDYFLARYYSPVQGRFPSPDDFLNDTHASDPASWNLYAYGRNNPLSLSDPTGEKVDVSGLSDREKQQLINDLKKKTGYVDISFDSKNNLVINKAAGIAIGPDGKLLGSANARQNLDDAIASADTFNVVSANSNNDLAFADIQLSSTTVNAQTNVTTRTYQVRIDFSDFRNLEGDEEAKDAFTIGLTALHEFDHKLYGQVSDEPNGRNNPGPVENTYINPIRAQLGLAQRATYRAVPVGNNPNNVYRELRFTLNGRDRMLRWNDRVVGGSHR